MRVYGSAVLLGCLALGCSGASYDQSKSPRTGAFQEPEEKMQPAARVSGDEDVVIVEREVVEETEPREQGSAAEDQRTTQRIRQALEQDASLSDAAKDVQVITSNRRVTLRGAVESGTESQRVEAHAERIAGPDNVDNRLEILKPQ